VIEADVACLNRVSCNVLKGGYLHFVLAHGCKQVVRKLGSFPAWSFARVLNFATDFDFCMKLKVLGSGTLKLVTGSGWHYYAMTKYFDWLQPWSYSVVGLRLGARGKTKKGAPLMTSSYSANHDKHIWSSLRYGHQRIGYVPETTAWLT